MKISPSENKLFLVRRVCKRYRKSQHCAPACLPLFWPLHLRKQLWRRLANRCAGPAMRRTPQWRDSVTFALLSCHLRLFKLCKADDVASSRQQAYATARPTVPSRRAGADAARSVWRLTLLLLCAYCCPAQLPRKMHLACREYVRARFMHG